VGFFGQLVLQAEHTTELALQHDRLGLRSTWSRTPGRSVMTIPNTELSRRKLDNFSLPFLGPKKPLWSFPAVPSSQPSPTSGTPFPQLQGHGRHISTASNASLTSTQSAGVMPAVPMRSAQDCFVAS
jgi:hypothetical protein